MQILEIFSTHIGSKAAYQSPLLDPTKFEALYTRYDLFIIKFHKDIL